MRRALYWVGVGFSTAMISLLLIVEGLALLGVAVWLAVQGAFFWLLVWLMFGTGVLGMVFAVGKVAAYGIGKALMAASGYEPEER